MIMKARSRAGSRQLARYLLTEHDHQKAFVIDQRGSVMDNLRDTLRSWETEAYALTKGEKPLYHMQIRLAPGESLQQSQWFHTLDVVEEKLKLTDHPRVVVVHNLDGEAHLHVVYSRLDAERGVLLNMGNDRRHHHATCRQLEKEFCLRELDSAPKRERNGNDKTRSIEHKMAKEAGTTRDKLCNLVKAAWDASRTGREFQQQLERFGITMTHGKSRDYIVTHNGKEYDPVRLLEEVRTKEFRAKMQIDPPRINEQDKAPEIELTARKSKNLTHDQIEPQLIDEKTREAAKRLRELTERLAQQRMGAEGIARRHGENLTSDQANKKFIGDTTSHPEKKRRRARKYKASAPRLRPKLWYGDPGI